MSKTLRAAEPVQGEVRSEQADWFPTTHWSVVVAAGRSASPDAQQALEKLCRTYWYPLYAFVRRQGRPPEEAQDLTQGFFMRLLAKEYIALADPTRGRFRSFLLTSLKMFLAETHRHATRLKRGGGQTVIPWDDLTAEQRYLAEPQEGSAAEGLYDYRWAVTLLESVLAQLRVELASAGREPLFSELKDQLWGEPSPASYAELSARLNLSVGALKVAVHRLRRRFRELLREEVARTVANPAEVDDELRYLVAVVRRTGL